jgi:hypothetical protein
VTARLIVALCALCVLLILLKGVFFSACCLSADWFARPCTAPGVNGPVVQTLNTTNTGTQSYVLTLPQILTMMSNGMYFNIHTAANPGGIVVALF